MISKFLLHQMIFLPLIAQKQVENGFVSSLGVSQTYNKIEFTLIVKNSSDVVLGR